jgi:hypothetical protein
MHFWLEINVYHIVLLLLMLAVSFVFGYFDTSDVLIGTAGTFDICTSITKLGRCRQI